MPTKLSMLSVELEGDDGLLVTFSDGTIAGYVVEEMLKLRPHREPTGRPPASVIKDRRYRARVALASKPRRP